MCIYMLFLKILFIVKTSITLIFIFNFRRIIIHIIRRVETKVLYVKIAILP